MAASRACDHIWTVFHSAGSVNGIMKGLVEPRLGKAGRGARQVNQGPAHLPRAEPFHPPELQEWLPLLGATHPAVRRGQAGP